ncbi:hypothetical protein [Streptomyces sp. NPDC050585]|uniref:hypothetical protein n=1 Tax=Streptomyces sp. NPDC050585 TaxID=3365632 RepID=UPI0037B64BF6
MITRSVMRTGVLAVGAALVLTAGVSTAPAAPSYVDKRVRACVERPGGGCASGTVVEYWYRPGSRSRGVDFVYASRSPVSTRAAYYARWTYRAPGKAVKVGGGWKRAAVVDGRFAEAHWGQGARHKGPTVPAGTVVCTHYEGSSHSACVTLR